MTPVKNPRPKSKAQRQKSAPRPTPLPPPPTYTCEIDVPEGLEKIARHELKTLFEERVLFDERPAKVGVLRFDYTGNLFRLLQLNMVQAVYLCKTYAVPRPKALLGDQHFKALLAQIDLVRELSPAGSYKTLYLNAAGSDSSVLTRLKDELAAKLGLTVAESEGDLLLRLRHAPDNPEAWEILVRISPRPLATRAWRVCNWEGALNAAVAYTMGFLTQPSPEDAVVNLMCGSGSLMIERLRLENAAGVIGIDNNAEAIQCAKANIEAAGMSEQISLLLGEATQTNLPDACADAVLADLPFGHLIGSHQDNVELYPAFLNEAARLTKSGGRCVLLSHEVRLMDKLLYEPLHTSQWDKTQELRVALGGLYPRIYVLKRK